MTRILLSCTAFAALFINPANATTYYYNGNPYTTNADPVNLGANMTGSVTFDFDTSATTGTYYLTGGAITDLQLTSGIYSLGTANFYEPLAYFSLAAGAITNWDLPVRTSPPYYLYTFNGLIGGTRQFGGDEIVTGGGPGVVIGAWVGWVGDPPGIPATGSGSPGIWKVGTSPAPPPPNPLPANTNVGSGGEVSAVPLPAALPLFAFGVSAMGFFGWRSKRKARA